ncbi:MAG: NADH-quinone oxidoreductase subunit L [Planctomycetota bacterium]|nr:NADH-quinone oxidoreductase subunit L [Planctomycetota bacterium]
MLDNISTLMGSALTAAPDAAAAPIGRVGSHPAWAPLAGLAIGLPLLACLLCGLCAAMKIKGKLPAWLTVASLAASFACILGIFLSYEGVAVAQFFRWFDVSYVSSKTGQTETFFAAFGVYVDSLTLLWMLFVTGLGTLIALYASEYMEHDVGAGYTRFFAAFSLFVFSMSCLVMADNLLLLYLGWEGVGLCSYLLIGYFYKKPSAVAAAKKAFIVNRIGDLGLALGIMLCWVHFGSIEYAVIFEKAAPYIAAVKAGDLSQVPMIAQLIPILLMIGAFGKSAQLPLYVWLPDAMEGPTPVSALIHAATMVTAGVFLIARTYPLFLCSEYALPIVAWVGTLTALLAATIGMAQFDIKRIMAYSTVSQLGYMFAGLGVLTSTGSAFHVLTHAFFKALLFLSCGAVMHGFAGQLDLRKLSGLWKVPGWTVVSVGMLVGCLNLAGFPLTAGFFSKDMIIAEAFVTPGFSIIGWLLLLTAGLTAYYTFRVFFRVFLGPVEYHPGDEAHGHDEHHEDAHGAHERTGHADASEHERHATSEMAQAEASLSGASGRHHGDGHGFHPHAPKWAINGVLAALAVLSIVAAGLYFVKSEHGHGGWVGGMVHDSSAAYTSPYGSHGHDTHAAPTGDAHAGDAHAAHAGGTFLGMDPHDGVMYVVSAIVGIFGIGIAYWLHLAGRTTAATSRADKLLPAIGPIATMAQNKWYVDELYDFLVRKPLLALAHVSFWIDKLIVDGIVDGVGWLPRGIGKAVRPAQTGHLHGYALGMAGGMAILLAIVLIASLI